MKATVGSTPLYELWPGELPNGNRVFIKGEFKNPTGSHYDRVYAKLFENDLQGLVENPPDYLVEVSSGNAGASFAWFCRHLGFRCKVFLPHGVKAGFRRHILLLNRATEIEEARDDDYVQGAVKRLRADLAQATKGGLRVRCINHSRREETIEATKEIGHECIRQLRSSYSVAKLDHFIAACGNGATIVGPVPALKEKYPGLTVTAFEPESAPVGYRAKDGKAPPPGRNHQLFGTGVWGVMHPFIHDDEAYHFKDLVNELKLIKDAQIEHAKKYLFKIGCCVGHTSLVALDLALEMAQDSKRLDQNILTLFYDDGKKYEYFS